MNKISIVALYHGIRWDCPFNIKDISPSIKLGMMETSEFNRIYLDLCEKSNIDDGDGFNYELYAVFDNFGPDEIFWDFGSPYTIVDQFSNAIALITGQPIGMCRVLWSRDDFKTVSNTEIIYSANEHIYYEFIKEWPKLSEDSVQDIATSFNNLKYHYDKEWTGRIANVASYYYSAWRSHSLDHMCINLAIVLELLFSPHSHSEINHQISYNVSRFLGKDSNSRRDIYSSIKQFYAVRSAIIHGGMPSYEKSRDITLKGYLIITNILRKILLDSELLDSFSIEDKRKELISNFIFD